MKLVKSICLALTGMVACISLVGCGAVGQKDSSNGLDGKPIKIGVLYSTTGAYSMSETTMQNAVKLAVDEINANGGINGSKIEAEYQDYASDPQIAAEKAQEMILKDGVSAIVGTNSSSSRLAVEPIIEQNDSLLVYNTFYEGEKPSNNVLYTNTSPSQQVDVLVPWMIKNVGKKVFLVGSDYEFPRTSFIFAKKIIEKNGGTVIGEEYIPTGHTDYSSVINKIKEANPDVVLSCVAGNGVVPFYKQYKQYGVDMKKIPICALATNESVARGIGDAAIGSYACFDYFNTIDTPENQKFVKDYYSKFGKDTTISNSTEAAYHGVYLLAEAIKKANSLDPEKIIEASKGLEIKTPGGGLKMDDNNHHAWLPVYIGKVNDSISFDILSKSEGLVKPDMTYFDK